MTDVQLNYAILATGIFAWILAIVCTEFNEKKQKKQAIKIKIKKAQENVKKAKRIEKSNSKGAKR
jgi:hypothetical protein